MDFDPAWWFSMRDDRVMRWATPLAIKADGGTGLMLAQCFFYPRSKLIHRRNKLGGRSLDG